MHHRLAQVWTARFAVVAAIAGGIAVTGSAAAVAQPQTSAGKTASGHRSAVATTAASFASGTLQDSTVGASGCGTNAAGEPAIHVSRAGNVFLGSELGVGGGSELWRGLGAAGGASASACGLEYRGQPNAVATGVGASGGDIDLANASAPNASGNYNLYVASLNLGSVNVATSTDNGTTFSQTPVQAGLPIDDREWIAAFGASTSLLTYHDVATNDINVLRSDNSGQTYSQISQVIPETDYKAGANELGNIVIDHDNLPNTTGGFYAYQAFVAPSSSSGSSNNEAWLGVSSDGGHTWTDQPIACSVTATGTSNGLSHNFPNVSVAPNGNIWYAWSDDKNIYTAESTDHGKTWTCSPPVSTNTAQGIFPWLAATSSGVDLVYYGAPTTGSNQTWSVYFAQNTAGSPSGWGTPQQLTAVHSGAVCESGATCTSGRQLFDDFGVDTDSSGWAHIAYSHDSPNLGGSSTATGYAVQTAGTQVGAPNN
ncbi:MAG TPA: sialidase family protein [Solirubrobacteraceae bacterium]|nr:sialidase family protein [Solirubrobacteraceae bacterium]